MEYLVCLFLFFFFFFFLTIFVSVEISGICLYITYQVQIMLLFNASLYFPSQIQIWFEVYHYLQGMYYFCISTSEHRFWIVIGIASYIWIQSTPKYPLSALIREANDICKRTLVLTKLFPLNTRRYAMSHGQFMIIQEKNLVLTVCQDYLMNYRAIPLQVVLNPFSDCYRVITDNLLRKQKCLQVVFMIV